MIYLREHAAFRRPSPGFTFVGNHPVMVLIRILALLLQNRFTVGIMHKFEFSLFSFFVDLGASSDFEVIKIEQTNSTSFLRSPIDNSVSPKLRITST